MKTNGHILIVDDDAVIIRIITNILNRNDYTTDSCTSGEEALEKIRQNEYDLVLLDVQMGSGLDGYETCQMIQQINPDLPVILVTANQDDESVNKGFESGSSDYIKKPVSKLELLARVNKTITLKRTEKRNLQLIDDLSKDLKTAANIQLSMLPKWIYLGQNIIFSSHYEPSETVGGDLFDRIWISENRYVVYIGDISGHGVQAALLMTAIKSTIKIMVENNPNGIDLPKLVTQLNQRLCQELFIGNTYMTLLIGVINLQNNEFQYLNAGHPPLLVIDLESCDTKIMDKKGSVPLGWLNNFTYTYDDTDVIYLTEKQIILLFTDGIYECANRSNEQIGIQGLIDILNHKIKIDNCISLPYKIKQYLTDNGYQVSSDDFTLLAFQKIPSMTYFPANVNQDKPQVLHYYSTLKASLTEVGYIAQTCEQLILNWTGNAKLAAKVELIIDEFLNNIVKHGYDYTEECIIIIEFSINNNKLSIKFWDKGIKWIPDNTSYSVDNPYDFEKDLYKIDGKGVKIIMSISNRFKRMRYDTLNETEVVINMN